MFEGMTFCIYGSIFLAYVRIKVTGFSTVTSNASLIVGTVIVRNTAYVGTICRC